MKDTSIRSEMQLYGGRVENAAAAAEPYAIITTLMRESTGEKGFEICDCWVIPSLGGWAAGSWAWARTTHAALG
ncbi:hypothetical protein Ancab_039037 [Ancistrocladus abbreviatus]